MLMLYFVSDSLATRVERDSCGSTIGYVIPGSMSARRSSYARRATKSSIELIILPSTREFIQVISLISDKFLDKYPIFSRRTTILLYHMR